MSSISMLAFGFLGLTTMIGLRAAHHLVRWGCTGPAGAAFWSGIKLSILLVGLVWLAPHIEGMASGTMGAVARVAQPPGVFYQPNLGQFAPAIMHMRGAR